MVDWPQLVLCGMNLDQGIVKCATELSVSRCLCARSTLYHPCGGARDPSRDSPPCKPDWQSKQAVSGLVPRALSTRIVKPRSSTPLPTSHRC
jgi:hypothetical protein